MTAALSTDDQEVTGISLQSSNAGEDGDVETAFSEIPSRIPPDERCSSPETTIRLEHKEDNIECKSSESRSAEASWTGNDGSTFSSEDLESQNWFAHSPQQFP